MDVVPMYKYVFFYWIPVIAKIDGYNMVIEGI